MSNKEYWIHKAILKEDAEVPNKKNKINITEHVLDLIGEVGTSSPDKVSITGDTMTGSLSLPSMVLNGNTINSISIDEIDDNENKLPTNSAVYLLHNTHANNQVNPHNVTKEQLNLSNVNNTSDLNKPISTSTQTALNQKVSKTGDIMSGSLKVITENVKANFDNENKNVYLEVNDVSNQASNYITPFGHLSEVDSNQGLASFNLSPLNINLSGADVGGTNPYELNLYRSNNPAGDTKGLEFNWGVGSETHTFYVKDTGVYFNDDLLALNNDVINFETTSQLNTRDVNNRNRSNHTGVQLYSTISNFETGVQIYEKAGYKKNTVAASTLAFDNLYIVEGTNTSLTLPSASGTGKRIMLVSTQAGVTAGVRLYVPTTNYLNDEYEGTYNFLVSNDVVELIDTASGKWVLKSLGEKPTPVFTGWAQYKDTTYNVGSPLVMASTVRTKLLNNAGIVLNSQLPTGVTSFWDETTNKLLAVNENDSFILDVRFKAKSTSVNDSFTISIDIGGALGEITANSKLFIKAANTEQNFSIPLHYFTGSTFITNGGEIYIQSTTGELSIYDINFLITRVHKGI
jgi:hypothetical protein